jgi:23S rRNA pseudouridine1911/1915/1917 synthase
MLPSFVFAQLTSELSVPNLTSYPFCFDIHAKPFSRNSFLLKFIQNDPGWGCLATNSPEPRATQRHPSLVSPVFATLTKTTGVHPNYSHSGTGQSSLTTRHCPFPCYNPRVSSAQIELLVAPSHSGTRLDRFVAANSPELSRARVQELIESGLVQVNGQPSKPSYKLKGGERITVQPEPRAPLKAEAESIPLDVLYEDDDLIIINKPAGMTVHAGAGNSRGTLVNALLGRGQSLSQGGNALRPGIVHRLDKDTSGAILIAKNDFAHAKLSESFRTRAIQKTYLALVQGKLTSAKGRIELAISRDPKRRMRMSARPVNKSANARAARTDWTVLQEFGPATLLEVQLHTGRTHQIRVHFSALKHPVVGDTLYGAASQLTIGKIKLPVLDRQFLHAARLSFFHPRTEKQITVAAPLAPELKLYLEALAAAAGVPKIDASLTGYL